MVESDRFEAEQVGCSAVVTGLFLSGVLWANQLPLLVPVLWLALYGVWRFTLATSRVSRCPVCDRELRFQDDVAFCPDCFVWFKVVGDRLHRIEGDHETSGLGFELTLGTLGLPGAPVLFPWGGRCSACDAPATEVVRLAPASVTAEHLAGAFQEITTATLEFPVCARHTAAVRTSGGALRFTHHRTWRELVDANR